MVVRVIMFAFNKEGYITKGIIWPIFHPKLRKVPHLCKRKEKANKTLFFNINCDSTLQLSDLWEWLIMYLWLILIPRFTTSMISFWTDVLTTNIRDDNDEEEAWCSEQGKNWRRRHVDRKECYSVVLHGIASCLYLWKLTDWFLTWLMHNDLCV